MANSTFFLITDTFRDVIIHGQTRLKVFVYHLPGQKFKPTEEQTHVFAVAKGELLAFETEAWSYEYLQLLSDAVHWYGRYIGSPDLAMSYDDTSEMTRKAGVNPLN